MIERLKEIQAQFVSHGDVGIDSIMWLMRECERLHQERAALLAAHCVVAVPDGRRCEMEFLTRRAFVIWEGHICVPNKSWSLLVRVTDNYQYDVSDVENFQPMRLIALAEWIDTLSAGKKKTRQAAERRALHEQH